MRVSPLGAAFAMAVVAGIILFVVDSGTVATVGVVVALVAFAFLIADQLPVRGGRSRRLLNVRDPEPEYIEKAEPASEEVWQREQELYRQRNE